MLFDSKLPKFLWTEAVNEACYNQNRLVSKLRSETPYEVYNKKKQYFKDFHIFGSEVYFKIPDEVRKKLDPKGEGRNPIKDQVIKDYQIEESSDKIQNKDTIEDIQNEDPEVEEQVQNQGINANQEEPNQNEEEDIDEEFHDAVEEQLPIQEPQVIQIEDEVRRSGKKTAGKLPSHLKDYELYQV
ncbi:hypothetical protein PVAND_004447 [Polypedilum vanderplanki]|uniref:Retrovirus-related Pol polyprotein from transposon TNT 1-94 n=1 Tax=Polypedilum vanderplanki TaxID=319348 RepID=A0A9J6BX77_POLVA|nr:hypothetical protein PVAND_004447 [Polypedilum vanderplanki]